MEVTEVPSMHRVVEFVCQFYSQFIYKAFTSKELSRICTLHLRDIVRYLRSLRASVCLLYKTFSLLLHIRKNLVSFFVIRDKFSTFVTIIKEEEIWNHWQNDCDHARSTIISDRNTSLVRGLCSDV